MSVRYLHTIYLKFLSFLENVMWNREFTRMTIKRKHRPCGWLHIKSFINFRFTSFSTYSRFDFYNVCVSTYFLNLLSCNTLKNTLLLQHLVTDMTNEKLRRNCKSSTSLWNQTTTPLEYGFLSIYATKIITFFYEFSSVFIREILTNYFALNAFNFSV